ncbi:WD40 repeat domain-containing protein [Mucilaginibacter sp. UYCu711]|uniref:WD40 repeat domain-containing protein n=1 Tax=Mucilaginibacter sp. UYCu711 TaxID=3156339 RepID=UPI003D208476
MGDTTGVDETDSSLIIFKIPLDEFVTGIGMLAGGIVAAGTAAGSLYLVESSSGNILSKFNAHHAPIQSLSTNGQNLIATGGQDGMLKIFERNSETPLMIVETDAEWVEKVEYSPDGKFLIGVAGPDLLLMNERGELIYQFTDHESTVSATCWRGDSKQFASACYSAVRFFDVRYQVPLQTLKWQNSMISLSWSPDFKFLCAGTQDSRIHFWPLPFKNGKDFEMSGYKGKVKTLSWEHEAKMIASNCGNEMVVWPFAGKAPLGQKPTTLTLSENRITALAFQPIGKILAAGDKRGLLGWFDPVIADEYLTAVQLDSEVVQILWSGEKGQLLAATAQGFLYGLKI